MEVHAKDRQEVDSFLGALRHEFGGKDIGFFAGVALLINNITGPGVPQLPSMFVESGWLLPVIITLAVWVMTSWSATMYCEAMRCIPGNEHFRDRIEYSTIMKYYFGRKWYIAAMIGLNGALQALNIISIMQSSQVMDSAIAKMFGATCGLNFTPFQNVWTDDQNVPHDVAHSNDFFSCLTPLADTGNGWGCHIVLSAGFIVTAAMAIPCGYYNLDDNMIVQKVAFVLTLLCWVLWIAAAASVAEMGSVPAVNNDPNTGAQSGVLGNILFNFGFVTTVPSWVNEKHPRVSINRTMWLSTAACVWIFFLIGLVGAAAFPQYLQGPVTNTCAAQVADQGFNCPNDLMQALTDPLTAPAAWSGPFASGLLNTSVYLFPIVAVVSSIPIFSIVIKYNLIENGFSTKSALWWGVFFPWVVSFPLLYTPNALSQFVNFTSLIFVSFTDFIVPCVLYVKLRKPQPGALLAEAEAPAPRGCHVHYACPAALRRKGWLGAIAIVVILTLSSACAFVLSIVQGSWAIDQQVCATVGS